MSQVLQNRDINSHTVSFTTSSKNGCKLLLNKARGKEFCKDTTKTKPKPIMNDLKLKSCELQKLNCYPLSEPDRGPKVLSGIQMISSNGDEKNTPASLSRSNSLESVYSGFSCDSSASEERQNTLYSVASYSSIASAKRKSETKCVNQMSTDNASSKTNNSKKETPVVQCNQKGGSLTTSATIVTPAPASTATPPKSRVEFHTNIQSTFNVNHTSTNFFRRMNSKNFDPTLEKSQTYLHGQNKNFSRANQYLTPARPGLQKLQINYTQTNTENNHLVIFADLVRISHKKNLILEETTKNLERRLLIRRNDPNRSTSYFINKGIRDPIRVKKKKTVRTVAEKHKARKERILKTTEEMKLGYVPTAKTIKPVTYEEMQLIRQCSYLRIDPKLQNDLCE